ncbi:MAG: fibronectin type III domain-containing protein [Nitrospirae bacterium]|nr:fibronectin type III domain-containing protein [Nitrospirota bacterium]
MIIRKEDRVSQVLTLKTWVQCLASLILFTLFLSGCGGGDGPSANNGGGTPGGGTQDNTATLSWDPVTTYADETPIQDALAGYKVYYGIESGNYTATIDVGNVTTYTVDSLEPGTKYYFAVTAYDDSGNESGYATEVSKSTSGMSNASQ